MHLVLKRLSQHSESGGKRILSTVIGGAVYFPLETGFSDLCIQRFSKSAEGLTQHLLAHFLKKGLVKLSLLSFTI